MEDFLETLRTNLGDGLFNVLNGIIVLVIGFFVVRIVNYLIKKIIARLPLNTTIAQFSFSIITALVYLLYILMVLNAFGLDTSGIVALVASVGLAIGVALKDSLSNIANGIMLVTSKPFNVGDYVEINETSGTVVSINLTTTVIQSSDNKLITIPNSEILSNNIVNYNAMTTRRLDLTISVAYGSDVTLVKELLTAMIKKDKRIFKDPKPVIELDELGDSSLNFTVKLWLKSGDYSKVKWSLNEQIVEEFNKNNIILATNHLNVALRN